MPAFGQNFSVLMFWPMFLVLLCCSSLLLLVVVLLLVVACCLLLLGVVVGACGCVVGAETWCFSVAG